MNEISQDREKMNECGPKGWYRLELQISPDGRQAYIIDGEYPPNPDGAEISPYGSEIIWRWLQVYNKSLKTNCYSDLKWYRKDKNGWPIEKYKNKPFKSLFRIIIQNIRKAID